MGENEDRYRRVRLRRWAVALIAVLIPVLLLLHVTLFNRWYLTPNLASEAFAYAELPVTNPIDMTNEECGAHLRCREALHAEEVSIYQFWFRDDAREFAESLGTSGHQSDWIVLRYENAKTDKPRRTVIRRHHRWDVDERLKATPTMAKAWSRTHLRIDYVKCFGPGRLKVAPPGIVTAALLAHPYTDIVDKVEIVVDGEHFIVTSSAPQFGYDFDWTNGPTDHYGFSEGSSTAEERSVGDLTESIRNFLNAFYGPGGIGEEDFPDHVPASKRIG